MDSYSQPEFYRFNRDSLELVNWVKSSVSACESLLDLGAGCGIIGLELARNYYSKLLVMVELQKDYGPFLEQNISLFADKIKCEIHFKSFAQWQPLKRFELIVCNPPYYLPGKGEASKDPRRGLARSFQRDDWKELLDCIDRSLALKGRAFLVLKNDEIIKATMEEALDQTNLLKQLTYFKDLVFLELFRLDKDRDKNLF